MVIYSLSPWEIPQDFPRAQAIFHRISRLESQYRHSQLPNNGSTAAVAVDTTTTTTTRGLLQVI